MRGQSGVHRVIERIIAAFLFALTLPITLAAAAASFVAFRAWPFFGHDRIGKDQAVIRLVKVRTLPPATDPYADKYAIADRPLPATMQWVRRLHLDELPQLLHVAMGDMRLVGPRPEMPGLHAAMPPAFAATRSSVRPGITGLWQIGRDCVGLIAEHPDYDLVYVDQQSLRLDLWILWRTALKMGRGRTITLDEIPAWALASPAPTAVAVSPRSEPSRAA